MKPSSIQIKLGVLLCLILASTEATQAADDGAVLFQDKFDGKLAEGWSWEREDRATWRTGPAGLEVRVQPGNMWGPLNNAKNVLVRPVPVPTDAPVEISVTFSNAPTAQWEQADLVWFYDDSNMVKLGQELVTGRFSIVMGREENDRARTVAIVPLDDHTVELRLQAFHNRIRGQFRTCYWSEWRDVGECDLPTKGEPKASLHFYNGPPNDEHWIKANNFALRRLKPESVHWPRVRASENVYRVTGGSVAGTEVATIGLGDKRFVLANNPAGLAGDAKADCEQRIFLHQDGSCGWSWDRRSSTGKQPILLGIGIGNFDPRSPDHAAFPQIGFIDSNPPKSCEMELNAVTRLENDHGDHNLSLHIWLNASEVIGQPPTHRIIVLFDWYGKEATGQSLNDGYRDYEYVEAPPSRPPGPYRGPQDSQYRIKGFRGAPPRVNLQAFVADAAKRGLPPFSRVEGVWFGNEIWDGSRGNTLVTRLDLVMDGKRYSSLPPASLNQKGN